MQINRITIIYFSPTGRTRRVARMLPAGLKASGLPISECNITDKWTRERARTFGAGDLVFFAVPVYYGRVPLPLQTLENLTGEGAVAVPIAVYGNRAYDDALRELSDVLAKSGFVTAAAGAFAAEHNQYPALGAGRPDECDRAAIAAFAEAVLQKLAASPSAEAARITLPGEGDYRPYGGLPVAPIPDEICRRCGRCVDACPVDIIDAMTMLATDPALCIGCRACTAACPDGARHYPAPVEARIAELMKGIAEKNMAPKSPVTFL